MVIRLTEGESQPLCCMKASNVGTQINVTAKVAVALSTVDPLVYVAERG